MASATHGDAGPAPPGAPGPGAGMRYASLPMADDRTAAYAILREAGPVFTDARGAYMVVSGKASEFVLKHPGIFSSREAFDRVGSPLPLVPLAFDPPEHTRYRQVLQPFFSPRATAQWQPGIRALARELI